jgi:butyryl-CoA dehydrogenase
LATIWTGSNEIMSMIIANEWYREHFNNQKLPQIRDYEADAVEADAPDEKIFE